MEESKKKRGHYIFRQELKNLTIETTPLCSFLCNLTVAILLLGCAIPIKNSVQGFKSYRANYTHCEYNQKLVNRTKDYNCKVNISIDEDLDGPVYVFYEIEDFYINHKEFIRSKQQQALRDNKTQGEEFTMCEGAQYMYQVKEDGNYTSIDGSLLQNTSIASPCGLIAKYHFNDRFMLYDQSQKVVPINETGIAYKEHKDLLFKNTNRSIQWLDLEDGKQL